MGVAGPIGLRIRESRKEAGITQADLAQRAGISASYLNLIEADKRAIGGTLLQRIASELEVDVDVLSGIEERRIVARLEDVAAQPQLELLGIDPQSANALVSRHPDWARAILELWRIHESDERHVASLTNRMSQDPVLSESIYRLLSNATAIRSTTEVLDTVEDLPREQHDRFVDIILSRSGELSQQAEHLVSLFGQSAQRRGGATPAEDVDDFFIQNHSWFPTLELAADRLRERFPIGSTSDVIQISRILEKDFGVSVATRTGGRFNDGRSVHFDAKARIAEVALNAPTPSIRFELAVMLCRMAEPECTKALVESEILSTDAARARASNALYAWTAGALILPYDAFLHDARSTRYDIEALCGLHGASVEQVFMRLVSLSRTGDEGIPFGFMKTDPSGFVSKRIPAPGLPLPRSGTGCPLWPVYSAFQTPERIIRQLSEYPNGAKYLNIARTVRRDPPSYRATPFLQAIMLTCDAVYGDQTVYGDGLDMRSPAAVTTVGPGCRMCSRTDCGQRNEPSALDRQKNR